MFMCLENVSFIELANESHPVKYGYKAIAQGYTTITGELAH
jgi:hypothetical protein